MIISLSSLVCPLSGEAELTASGQSPAELLQSVGQNLLHSFHACVLTSGADTLQWFHHRVALPEASSVVPRLAAVSPSVHAVGAGCVGC